MLMRKIILLTLLNLVIHPVFTQESNKIVNAVNALLAKHNNHSDSYTILNHVEMKNDSIEIIFIYKKLIPKNDKPIDVKITYCYYPSDILEITNGIAPAHNRVIYLKTKGQKINSCYYKKDGKIEKCELEKIQNLVLGKMSDTEINSIQKLLISLFNDKGGNIKVKP